MFKLIISLLILSILLYPATGFCEDIKYSVVVSESGKKDKKLVEIAEMVMCDLGKSGKIKLVDRLHFEAIMDEYVKMEMGLVENKNKIDFGKLEGVDKLITISYKIDGKKIFLTACITDVKTAITEISDSVEGNKNDTFYFAHQLANKIHYKITGLWVPEINVASNIPSPTHGEYKNQNPQQTDPSTVLKNNKEEWNNSINLSVDKGELSTYYNGDTMKINFSSKEDCFMTIYSINTLGKVNLVFPNGYDKENFLQGGKTVTIPPKNAWWDYVMEGTPGMEALIAIGSKRPLKLEIKKEGFTDVELMPEVNSSPNEFIINSLIPRLKLDKENKWVVKIVKYYLAEKK